MEKNTDNNKRRAEIRTTPCRLAVREAEPQPDGTQGESRTITGTAIVFNEPSQVIDDWGEQFQEIIKPEAASKEFLDSQDIKLNLLHDRENTIGRANKGVGNLKLTVDDKGVNFEIDAPRCDIGDRALELVRAGVYSGCSFEFWPKDYEIKETKGADGKTLTTVTHTAFESIGALTIAMDPAYEQTSVAARELHGRTPAGQREKAAAEQARRRGAEAARARLSRRERETEDIDIF